MEVVSQRECNGTQGAGCRASQCHGGKVVCLCHSLHSDSVVSRLYNFSEKVFNRPGVAGAVL